jgi:hypothetical protein
MKIILKIRVYRVSARLGVLSYRVSIGTFDP